jgi:hypothetical protein
MINMEKMASSFSPMQQYKSTGAAKAGHSTACCVYPWGFFIRIWGRCCYLGRPSLRERSCARVRTRWQSHRCRVFVCMCLVSSHSRCLTIFMPLICGTKNWSRLHRSHLLCLTRVYEPHFHSFALFGLCVCSVSTHSRCLAFIDWSRFHSLALLGSCV